MQSELTALSVCKHPNILELKGILAQQELLRGIGLVLQIAEFGTLHNYLHTDKPLFVKSLLFPSFT